MQQQSNISQKYQLDKESMIRFQILLYCYMNGMFHGKDPVNITEIDCLTLVGLKGTSPLLDICKELVGYGLFKTMGSVRNALTLLQERNMVVKEKKKGHPKTICIHPSMKICTDEIMVMDIKCYSNVSTESR